MKKISIIVGARPNFMKAFPVYEALKNDFELTLIHTGQHFDEKMSKVFFEELGFPKPDIHFSLASKTRAGELDNKLYVNNKEYLKNIPAVIEELRNYDSSKLGQLGEIRDKLQKHFKETKPDLVVVFGDVTSTASASLACKNLGIEIAHVESGLRSGDKSMPEEVNRIITDNIATYFFVTEQSGIDNLKNEGMTKNVFLVGNTMIDTQKKYLQKALDTKYWGKLGLKEKKYVLITLHRPGNVDDLTILKNIFDDLFELSKKEKLVYPIHPRTKNNLEKIGYLEKVKANENIVLDEPLGYLEFTCLMANCKYLVTDSGGLQEESTALNIPCFTLRPNTERPSTLIENNGTNQLIKKISDIELKECKGSMVLWDGKSSEKICKIFIENNINFTLKMSKKELNSYIINLKEKYDIPTKYTTGELLKKTKNKKIVINNKSFEIDLPNIWKLKESSNTKYQIHTLNQIIQSQIALFFYKEFDINIIKFCIHIIENWFDNNEKIDLSKWYNKMEANWQDMSTSYRLGNILLVYELANKFNIDINKEKFKKEIFYHIEWLKSHLIHNKTLEFSSNHNLFISRYLILGTNIYNIYFKKLEDIYIDLGIKEFIETISNNIDMTDLLSKEHSTNYHILYYRQLNKLLSILDEDNKNFNKLKDLSNKMYNNLNYFIYPNNQFVQIGDTDDKLSNYEFKNLETLKLFKNVGYGIYKKENVYLSLSSSCHSKYHKHIDELSINYFNEYPILIEGGRYSYDDYKPNNVNELWRNTYFLSQRSKNSVVIDDNYFSFRKILNQLNNKSYTYSSGITNGEIKETSIIIQGTNPLLLQMQNIHHNRKLILDKNNILLVEDKLVSEDNNEHKSTRHFHFHYDWELIEIVKNKVIFKHKISNKILEFEDLSNGEIKYYCGQEKPFIQGFTSDYEHNKIALPTLEIINIFKGKLLLKSKLKFINNYKSMHFFSKDNTKLYCLNSCPIRKKHMHYQLEKLDVQYEFIDGFTDNNLFLTSNKNLKESQVNISLGFYKIFEKFYFDKNIEYAIICEDDIIFENTELIKLLNNYNVDNIRTDNFIIYGCCLFTCSSKNNELGKSLLKNEFKFIETTPKFGHPCFIISKKYAELILENFYPLNLPFDNYMKKIVKEKKINSYYSDPFICYELSSGYYKYLYKEKHKNLLESFSFKRLSGNLKSKNYNQKVIFSYNKYMGKNFGDTLNTYIFNKINSKIKLNDNEKHFLLIGSILNQKIVNKNSIICGTGIIKKNDHFNSNKPMTTIMVRGPYTRDNLIKKCIFCPKNYGDIGMLINCLYPKNNTPKFKLGIIPHVIDYDYFLELFKDHKNLKVISLQCEYDKVESVIDEIINCEYIISTSLHGIITGHAYNKKVLWLDSYKGLFGDNIKFLDYYESLQCFNVSPYNCEKFIKLSNKTDFIKNIVKEIELFSQPNLKLIETHKYKMKKLIPFYYDLFQTKIVIITRFGINMKDKEWYDYRYIVHKAFGQSCILNQTNQNFEWLICLDSNPPEDFFTKLKNDFPNKYCKNIHLINIKNDFISEYRSYIEENILTNETNKLIIIRKDDDDALNINFIENIYDYLQNNEINLHFIEENNKNFTRVQEWRDKWFWGDKIIDLFDNKQDIINQLFFSRNGNEEIKVYYKNDYIQSFGSPTKYGSIENQLLSFKNSVEKNIDKSFTPFAIINNPSFGFQYKYEENNDKLYISDIPGTSVGIYSILPIKNKKITNYRDCMYENRWGHININKTKGVKFNNISNGFNNYVFVRGLINDCGEDVKRKYCLDNEVINLNIDIINDFSINKKFLQEFKDINKKYNNTSVQKFKYVVDKNIKNIKN